ncbi:hypothetical protein ACFQ0G_52760 [Streptomyces chiangmaiensis]
MWPFHVHDLIRAAIRSADDTGDDRWSEQDWRRAAQRAFHALESQWRQDLRRDRAILVGCLQQGLLLARNFHLDLGWLGDAAFQYVGDSIWEPLVLPAADAAPSGACGPLRMPWWKRSVPSPGASTNTVNAQSDGSPPSLHRGCSPMA